MATQVTTGLLANNAVTDAKLHADFTATTQSASDNSTSVATTAYVTTAIANLADSAPSTLNTLNELAAALGDDANFSTTVTNSIAGKLPLAGGTMTGHILLNNAVELRSKDTGGSVRTITRINNSNELEYGYSGSGPVKFMGGGSYTERMRIHTDGNVGIGTDSPGQKLEVAGNIFINAASGNPDITIKTAGTGNNPAVVYRAGDNTVFDNMGVFSAATDYWRVAYGSSGSITDELLAVTSTGFVGIGTTSPRYNLTVNGNNSTAVGIAVDNASGSSTLDIAALGSGYNSHQAVGGEVWFYSPDNINIGGATGSTNDIKFLSNNTVNMVIKGDSGKVGIGNPSPTARFDLGTNSVTRNSTYDVSANAYISTSGGAATNTAASIPLTLGRDDDASTGDEIGLTYNFDNGNWSSTAGVFARVEDASTAYTSLDLRTWGGGWSTGLTVTSAGNVGITAGKKFYLDGISDTYIQEYSANEIGFYTGGAQRVKISGGHLYSNNNIYSGTTSTTSNMYTLNSQTNHGTWGVGSHNSSYVHFTTDRGIYYFNTRCEASGGFHTYSDENLKKDITPLTGALDDVAKMNGITFKWKDADNRGGGSTGKQFGVTAQNMLTVDSELPTLNKDPLYNIKDGIDENDEYYTMDYARLSPYFIEAIKELKTKLEAAEARITELEG